MAPPFLAEEELDRRKVRLSSAAPRILKTAETPALTVLQIVRLNAETIDNITSTDFPGHYWKENNAWDLSVFKLDFSVAFHHNEKLDSSFSLIGIDASLANAFRRILIAEIPTLAIETVFMEDNTSVVQDEVLSHRLGLVPFKGGKEGLLNFMKWYRKPGPGQDAFANTWDVNTVQMKLNVECTRIPGVAPEETDPAKLYKNANVYAKDLVFSPIGRQEEYFSGENAIAPVHPDILLAKLRPGQAIALEAHMHKGIGADHAKFSPVATASYRLLPAITIMKPIVGADAEKFAGCFAEGVIGLTKVTRRDVAKNKAYEGHEGKLKAVVLDPMKDTVSRECMRHPEFEGKVKLGRRRDHFIFSIESTGQWDSDELFLEAVKTLKEKCKRLENQVLRMTR